MCNGTSCTVVKISTLSFFFSDCLGSKKSPIVTKEIRRVRMLYTVRIVLHSVQ